MVSLKQSYLRMKELIKDNRPPLSGHRLMTDFPKTQLDMFTYGEGTESSQEASLARLLPENSLERKYVVLDSILQYHMGEIRAWGGDWEIRQGPKHHSGQSRHRGLRCWPWSSGQTAWERLPTCLSPTPSRKC